MKKILCYFLLLILPTFIFSQDTSLLTENFSLVNYSKDKNPNFFIPNMALSVNNLFQTEEKCDSDQYKLSQTQRFQQSSEQPSLLEVLVFQSQKHKWGYKYSPDYGQVQNQDIVSEKKLESLAEGYLERLAERKKKSRKTWGAFGLIGGGLFIGLGASVISSAGEGNGWEGFGAALAGVMFIAAGTGGIIVGTLSLALPSGAEREHKNVLRISDPAQRERACRSALSSLASRGKRRRMLTGILSAVYFFGYILSSKEAYYDKEEIYMEAATFGVLSVYEFTRKSAAERAYQNYLKETEHQSRNKTDRH